MGIRIYLNRKGDIKMKLGDNILILRRKQGISQEKLGEEVNVTRQTISNWELGETTYYYLMNKIVPQIQYG